MAADDWLKKRNLGIRMVQKVLDLSLTFWVREVKDTLVFRDVNGLSQAL